MPYNLAWNRLVARQCVKHHTIKAYRTVEMQLHSLTVLLTGKET